MQISNLWKDDSAVSPVIGVILMVAITVILAAVIASFVLGLGNTTGEVAPSGSFSFDYDSDTDVLEITYDGGDPIRYDELFVRGEGFTGLGDDLNAAGNWPQSEASGSTEGVDAVSGGDSITVGVSSDYDISVVWDSKDSGKSSELQDDSGPDA